MTSDREILDMLKPCGPGPCPKCGVKHWPHDGCWELSSEDKATIRAFLREFKKKREPKPDPQPPEDDTVPPLSDCDGDQCTIGASYHPDFNGKASTTKREPSYKVKLSASTPDGTTYEQDTDIEWTPPPSTAVLVATMKKDEGVR